MAFGSWAEENGGVRNIVQGEPFDFLYSRVCCRVTDIRFLISFCATSHQTQSERIVTMKSYKTPQPYTVHEKSSVCASTAKCFFFIDSMAGIAKIRTWSQIKQLENAYTERVGTFQIRYVCRKSAGARTTEGAAAFTICAALCVFQIAKSYIYGTKPVSIWTINKNVNYECIIFYF